MENSGMEEPCLARYCMLSTFRYSPITTALRTDPCLRRTAGRRNHPADPRTERLVPARNPDHLSPRHIPNRIQSKPIPSCVLPPKIHIRTSLLLTQSIAEKQQSYTMISIFSLGPHIPADRSPAEIIFFVGFSLSGCVWSRVPS